MFILKSVCAHTKIRLRSVLEKSEMIVFEVSGAGSVAHALWFVLH